MHTETDLKLAKAKAIFSSLESSVRMRREILCGRIRGSKTCWKILEEELERGARFFSDVKGIADIGRGLTENGENDGKEQ